MFEMEQMRRNKMCKNGVIQFHSLEAALGAAFGDGVTMTRMTPVYGGDINEAYRISLSSGEVAFLKTNSVKNAKFFEAELLGLSVLRAAGKIGVPKTLGTGIDQQKAFSFLLLEYIDSAPRIKTYWETFGHELARLHRSEEALPPESQMARGKYGFPQDNFIGSNPQKNQPKETWADFYRECRLLPQIKMADGYLDSSLRKKLLYLLDHLDVYLREPEFPSLLHGDLWSGNVLCGNDGKAWILDPAAYVGDYETDLAMTQLFGSFPSTFYAAYNEENPMEPDYLDRKPLYQLYHLLNHFNLFGSSYLGSVVEIIKKYAP